MKVAPRRLSAEDFKDIGWIARLLGPLNDHISQVVQAMSNQLTIQDNLRAEIKELEVRTSDVPIKFRCRFPEKPKSIVVGYVEEITGSPLAISSPVWVHWTWDSGVVTILSITGIGSTSKYRINLKVDYV